MNSPGHQERSLLVAWLSTYLSILIPSLIGIFAAEWLLFPAQLTTPGALIGISIGIVPLTNRIIRSSSGMLHENEGRRKA